MTTKPSTTKKTPRAPSPAELALAEALRAFQTSASRASARALTHALEPLLAHHAAKLAQATREAPRDCRAQLEAAALLAALRFDWTLGVYPLHFFTRVVRDACWAETRRARKRRERETLFPTGHSVFEGVRRRNR